MEKIHYKVSQYYRGIAGNSKTKALIYHSIFGRGLIASCKLKDLIDLLREKTFDIVKLDIPDKIISELKKRYIIIESTFDEDEYINNLSQPKSPYEKITHLRLCMSENCNLSCTYCYVDCKNENANMPFEVAQKAVKGFFSLLQNENRTGDVTFFGGEPIINWKILKEVILYIKELDPERKVFKKVSMVTNGTLLDKEKALFLKNHSVLVSISYDGPKDVNDKVRITKMGKGSFDKIVEGIEIMRAVDYPPSSLVCTIGDHNVHCLDDVVSFSANKKIYLNINDAFAEPRESVYAVSDGVIADSLYNAEIYARKKEIRIGGTWKWAFERLFEGSMSLRHCVASGGELSVDCDGNIKPCPGFDMIYGTVDDIEEIIKSEAYKRICSRLVPMIPECRGCDIEGLCAGGCMLNASKNHNGDIFRKSESCYLFKTLFMRLASDLLNKNDWEEYFDGLKSLREKGHVSVYSDRGGNLENIERYADFIDSAVELVSDRFKCEVKNLNICIVFDEKQFCNIGDNQIPKWASCFVYRDALIQKGSVVESRWRNNKNVTDQLRGMIHEIGHIITYQYCKLVPNWLSEGISEYIANELCPDKAYDLVDYVSNAELEYFFDHSDELLISRDSNYPLNNGLYFKAYLYVQKLLDGNSLECLLDLLGGYDGREQVNKYLEREVSFI